MIPTNTKSNGCVPVSSNCIQWQGPDIPFLNLCNGSSITEVAYGIANQVKEIMDSLDVTTYDMACLNLGKCGPSDFKELLQIVISKFCDINSSSTTSEDDEVQIPTCLQEESGGEKITTGTVAYLAKLTAKKLCSLYTDFTEAQSSISELRIDVNELQSDVSELKEGKQDYLDNNETDYGNSCFYNSNILQEVKNIADYLCGFKGVLGDDSTNISSAITRQCVSNTDYRLSNTSSKYSESSYWSSNPSNIANTIGNLWLVVCDLRSALTTVMSNLPTASLTLTSLIMLCCNKIRIKLNSMNDSNAVWDSTATCKIYEEGSSTPTTSTIQSFDPKTSSSYNVNFTPSANKSYTAEIIAEYTENGISKTAKVSGSIIPAVSNLDAVYDSSTSKITVTFDTASTEIQAVLYKQDGQGTPEVYARYTGSTSYSDEISAVAGVTYTFTIKLTDCTCVTKTITTPSSETYIVSTGIELTTSTTVNNSGADDITEAMNRFKYDTK